MYFKILTFITLFFTVLSCSVRRSLSLRNEFKCQDYWLQDSINWVEIDTNTYQGYGEVLMQSSDSAWGVLYPGSLIKVNDTIWVALEAGRENTCRKIEASEITGETGKLKFNNISYAKSSYDMRSACGCKWN